MYALLFGDFSFCYVCFHVVKFRCKFHVTKFIEVLNGEFFLFNCVISKSLIILSSKNGINRRT